MQAWRDGMPLDSTCRSISRSISTRSSPAWRRESRTGSPAASPSARRSASFRVLEAPLAGADVVELNPLNDPIRAHRGGGRQAGQGDRRPHAHGVPMIRSRLPCRLAPDCRPRPRRFPGRGPGGPAIDYAKLRDETAQRLSEYIRINTSNPPGNELATARWLADVLAKEGDPGDDPRHRGAGPRARQLLRPAPGHRGGKGDRPGAPHGRGAGHAPRTGPSIRSAGAIKDGYVWGRGALDMKGHGIIQLMALIALKRAGVPLTRDLVYVGNADEEIGGLGSRTFIERHPDLVKPIEYLLTEGADTRVEKGSALVRHRRRREADLVEEAGREGHDLARLGPAGRQPGGAPGARDRPDRGVPDAGAPHAGGGPLLQGAGTRRDRSGKGLALERRGGAEDPAGPGLAPELSPSATRCSGPPSPRRCCGARTKPTPSRRRRRSSSTSGCSPTRTPSPSGARSIV